MQACYGKSSEKWAFPFYSCYEQWSGLDFSMENEEEEEERNP